MEGEERRLQSIRSNLERRALVYETTRAFFRERGFLEVETPVRVPVVAPESYIVPIESDGWFMSTSPELHMKRLLAAGYERLFQICHCFRKGERGRWHNPEFSMIEWYRAGANYLDMVNDTEELVLAIADRLGYGQHMTHRGQEFDLSAPWPKATVREAFLKNAGWDPVTIHDPVRFDMDLVTSVIPGFSPCRPTVLMDYPAAMGSLARLKAGGEIAERAEVFLGDLELANAYSELNNSEEQERRFQLEIESIRREQHRKADIPRRFLDAVCRLPDCGGIALGMDRLVMFFCGATSIDEVVPFTVDTA